MKNKIILAFLFLINGASINPVFSQPFEPYFNRLEPAQPDVRNGGMAVALAVKPGNENHVIAATSTGGLMKTINHSSSWFTLFNFPGGHFVRHVQYAPMNTNHVIVVTSSNITSNINEGGIWLSRNEGTTWERPPSGIPPAGFHTGQPLMGNCISTYPGSRRILVGTNMGLAISEDDGLTWSYRNVPGTEVNSAALLRNNAIVISTPAGIYFWDAGGWSRERTGIGTAYVSPRIASHNSFYVPSRFSGDVSTANPVFVVTPNSRIYLSGNGGQQWSLVDTFPERINYAAKGTGFVKMATTGFRVGSQGLDLYVTNQYGIWRKFCERTGTNFSYRYSEGWQRALPTAHTDLSDMCLDRDGNPWLLAGDGGVQKFWRNAFGDNFSFDGGGESRNGFHGLQVTEISGMYINSRREYDMYFSTQDNNVFASENRGVNWINNDCCEGFYLEHARQVNEESEAQIGYVACADCANKISRRVLRDIREIVTPSGIKTTPLKYLNKNTYLVFRQDTIRTKVVGAPSGVKMEYYVTSNYNSPDSRPDYSLVTSILNIDTRGIPKRSATPLASRSVLYQPYKAASDGGGDLGYIQRVKMMRMVVEATTFASGGSYFYGEARFPANRNLGSIGVFPTEFAWYEVFAANPVVNTHLIAADAVNRKMMQSFNGGEDWTEIPELTSLVTEGGTRPFNIGRFTNTSVISFNPDFPQMILVGTRESGIFYSWNGGANWDKIPGSEKMPEVSSFYFQNNNIAWVSSYGRGLWKIYFSINRPRSALFYLFRNQVAYTLIDAGRMSRVMSQEGSTPDNNANMNMEFDQALIVTDGSIENIYMNNDMVAGVQYSPNSSAIWLTDENYFKPAFPAGETESAIQFQGQPMEKISELVKQGYSISGLLLKGNQIVDVIYGKEPVPFPYEKKYLEYEPVGEKEMDEKLIPRFTVHSDNMLAGNCYVYPGGKLMISGNRFDGKSPYPVSILIDGQPTDIFGEIKIDNDGRFIASTNSLIPLGFHTITVQQPNADQQLIVETDEFIVMHRDEPVAGPSQDQPKKEPNKPINEKINELKNKIKNIINNKN